MVILMINMIMMIIGYTFVSSVIIAGILYAILYFYAKYLGMPD